MKGNPVLYKSLVVGVILLFVGIGLQPAFAINVSNTISDDENDCDVCPSIEDVVDSKDLEKYQELSDRISTIYNLNKNEGICNILFIFVFIMMFKAVFIFDLLDIVHENLFPLFSISYIILFTLFATKYLFVAIIWLSAMDIFHCPDPFKP